jgi:hypothetical protein
VGTGADAGAADAGAAGAGAAGAAPVATASVAGADDDGALLVAAAALTVAGANVATTVGEALAPGASAPRFARAAAPAGGVAAGARAVDAVSAGVDRGARAVGASLFDFVCRADRTLSGAPASDVPASLAPGPGRFDLCTVGAVAGCDAADGAPLDGALPDEPADEAPADEAPADACVTGEPGFVATAVSPVAANAVPPTADPFGDPADGAGQ